jgi:hypothetical protein
MMRAVVRVVSASIAAGSVAGCADCGDLVYGGIEVTEQCGVTYGTKGTWYCPVPENSTTPHCPCVGSVGPRPGCPDDPPGPHAAPANNPTTMATRMSPPSR